MEVSRSVFHALGTTGVVVTTDRGALAAATDAVFAEVAAIDLACSRFRADSDLSRLNASAPQPASVSPLLLDALEIALRAARVTDGDVDPTVGRALRIVGYDRDFSRVAPDGPGIRSVTVARRWPEITIDRDNGTASVPSGVELDLGATAKAFAADRAAAAAHTLVGCGVLVSLGGDLSLAGTAPPGGWPVLLSDHHDAHLGEAGPTVALFSGGLATSGTAARRWRRGGVEVHHLIDPGTGRPVPEVWRTVSVAAASCVDANIASTAAMIRGVDAPRWLAGLGLQARLVTPEGDQTLVGSWCAPVETGVGSA